VSSETAKGRCTGERTLVDHVVGLGLIVGTG